MHITLSRTISSLQIHGFWEEARTSFIELYMIDLQRVLLTSPSTYSILISVYTHQSSGPLNSTLNAIHYTRSNHSYNWGKDAIQNKSYMWTLYFLIHQCSMVLVLVLVFTYICDCSLSIRLSCSNKFNRK